ASRLAIRARNTSSTALAGSRHSHTAGTRGDVSTGTRHGSARIAAMFGAPKTDVGRIDLLAFSTRRPGQDSEDHEDTSLHRPPLGTPPGGRGTTNKTYPRRMLVQPPRPPSTGLGRRSPNDVAVRSRTMWSQIVPEFLVASNE